MQKKRPIVIVGNGGAGLAAAKALRVSRYQEEIVLISDYGGPAYNPMLIPYFIAGKIPLEKCAPFGFDFDLHEALDLDISLGSPVVKLDTRQQFVKTARGKKIYYSQCLIATGASPQIPPVLSGKSKRILALRTISDAVAIKQLLLSGTKKALVVGASMVGIKMAEVLLEAGLTVSLTDMAEHIFPSAAHPESASIMEKRLREHGVQFRLQTTVENVEMSTGKSLKIYFASGDTGEFDLIIVGTGIRPNLKFVDPGQVAMDKGIIIDSEMRSNVPNVFAAGDVGQGNNLLTGEKQLIPLWSNAIYGGRTAGRIMAGLTEEYTGSVPHNISRFCGIEFVSIGNIFGGDSVSSFTDGTTYIRLAWHNGNLIGANLINCRSPGKVKQAVIKNIAYNNAGKGFVENLWRENATFQNYYEPEEELTHERC